MFLTSEPRVNFLLFRWSIVKRSCVKSIVFPCNNSNNNSNRKTRKLAKLSQLHLKWSRWSRDHSQLYVKRDVLNSESFTFISYHSFWNRRTTYCIKIRLLTTHILRNSILTLIEPEVITGSEFLNLSYGGHLSLE